MTASARIPILPYSFIVGQDKLKLALELAFVAPTLGGVLISGQRGTAKSTAVRAFARMVYGTLPVTLPINATDDRVMGGWKLDQLMRGQPEVQPGLLEEANRGMLYVDEINLLDDHIVNLLLDVASTGVLTVQRDMIDRDPVHVSFTIVGTMNPEEGGLRPQLLDRFGLMVAVTSVTDLQRRRKILDTVLRFDDVRRDPESSDWLRAGLAQDESRRDALLQARDRLYDVVIPDAVISACANIADHFQAAGHRGDYVMALAARARAALDSDDVARVGASHLEEVAALALAHRTPQGAEGGTGMIWTDEQQSELAALLPSD